MADEERIVDLAEMSDEEIMNLDPSELEGEGPETTGEENQSEEVEEEAGDDSEGTGGADPEDDQMEPEASDDSTSDEAEVEDGNESPRAAETEAGPPADDQSTGPERVEAPAVDDPTDLNKAKDELAQVMAPFKAANRMVTPKSVDDVRRLMQMGVDYTQKMTALKPVQRIVKTLENNDLLDLEKINFLINLEKKDPDTIRKFLKDSKVDPLDLNLEDDISYRPTDHTASEGEIALDEVIASIRDTSSFKKTVDIITNQWDKASKKILSEEPTLIRVLNEHMEAGIYDMIADRVASDRSFGRLTGLSDLEAYKAAGDAIHAEGGFGPPPNQPAPAPTVDKGNQGNAASGSAAAQAEKERQSRKRAAGAPISSGGGGKPKLDLSTMSDEEILNLDVGSL